MCRVVWLYTCQLMDRFEPSRFSDWMGLLWPLNPIAIVAFPLLPALQLGTWLWGPGDAAALSCLAVGGGCLGLASWDVNHSLQLDLED